MILSDERDSFDSAAIFTFSEISARALILSIF